MRLLAINDSFHIDSAPLQGLMTFQSPFYTTDPKIQPKTSEFFDFIGEASFYDRLSRLDINRKVMEIFNISFGANNLKDSTLGA